MTPWGWDPRLKTPPTSHIGTRISVGEKYTQIRRLTPTRASPVLASALIPKLCDRETERRREAGQVQGVRSGAGVKDIGL
jgi:hypothetical protein